jgi:CubicO group peptidase (beta-lactamase class C family)
MSDLEHDIRNTPQTIFEAGSVSKQFTAAAVLMLASDGRLSLDDPARKYIPELPDYGVALTVRHMLTHTSGLRDWGSVAGMAGWPRTTRVHTHAHVLEIVSRQRALNFTPGTRSSYSNTGYNLAAILVSRVSGMSFAEFTRLRIFEPLGMTRTSWRDDHTRIVKDRAIAYAAADGGFRILMPFENVHGNGGLLTTVGDLLKWNQNFTAPVVGDAAFVSQQLRPGTFADGRAHDYGMGLYIGQYKGVEEVSHGGATAGYRAFLGRYPDQRLSVAVLCNAGSASAPQLGHAVADLYLGDRIGRATTPSPTHVLTSQQIEAATGLYKNSSTGVPLSIIRDQAGLRIQGGPALVPRSATAFVTADGEKWEMDGNDRARLVDAFGTVETFIRAMPAKPSDAELQELVGTYLSDEAEASMALAIADGSLVLKRRPDSTLPLTPVYRDAFSGDIGLLVIRRDEAGRPNAFSIVQGRVWDMRFVRTATAASTSRH